MAQNGCGSGWRSVGYCLWHSVVGLTWQGSYVVLIGVLVVIATLLVFRGWTIAINKRNSLVAGLLCGFMHATGTGPVSQFRPYARNKVTAFLNVDFADGNAEQDGADCNCSGDAANFANQQNGIDHDYHL